MINHVLVIDDDNDFIETLKDFLILYGIQKSNIHTAQNPIKGLEIFREHQKYISLVIVDYYMPRSNGAELCEILKKGHPNLKIIMQTGDTNLLKTQVQNIDHLIHKPYGYDEITKVIEGLTVAPPEFSPIQVEERSVNGPLEVGQILLEGAEPLATIILNQSKNGVGIAMKPNSKIKVGDTISFRAYKAGSKEHALTVSKTFRAKIVWVKIINIDLCTLGLQWLS